MSQSPHSDETSELDENQAADQPDSIDDDQDRQIDELVEQVELTHESPDFICKDNPELVAEVRRRVAALHSIDKQLAKRKRKRSGRIKAVDFGTFVKQMEFVDRGGLGEVYVGKDEQLRRRVAIKFMHKRHCGEPSRRSQFKLEAEITGRLEHPGVVPIYGCGGTKDERPFYAMRYIEGRSMDQAIKDYYKRLDEEGGTHSSHTHGAKETSELTLEFRHLLSSFVSVCNTIAYAHDRGVVHRDIKPANIMIGRFGETLVVDWGLAVPVMREERFRKSGEETLMSSSGAGRTSTGSGRGAGTPAFMSPEQFSELDPTPACDVYSLGATLFAILAGKPPIRSSSFSDIRTDRLEGKLPDLNQLRKGVPKQLQAIAHKAMQREAKDRYATALDLANDVERFLADEPVAAYEDTVGLKVARLARRHRYAAQTAVLGLALCFLVAGLSAFWIQIQRSNANALRDRNLSTSATFIARACGYEIDRVWRVLEFEAQSPQLIQFVKAANAAVDQGEELSVESQREFQYYLDSRLKQQGNVETVTKIFVLTQGGTQAARVPEAKEPQIGENFAFRDYYTGLGFDLDKVADARFVGQIKEPLQGPRTYEGQVHITSAYLSSQVDERYLKLTLTLPIREVVDGEERFIGVIGTSITAGDLIWATRITDENALTWIADLREDSIDSSGRRRRGVILHSPESQDAGPQQEPERLPNDLVEELRAGNYAMGNELADDWIHGTKGVEGHLSIQPVRISGRSADPFDVGWVVITAEASQ